jgi:hypothetical protein
VQIFYFFCSNAREIHTPAVVLDLNCGMFLAAARCLLSLRSP